MILLPAALPAALAPNEIAMYIGTYTSEGGSRGIYRAMLDTRTGLISTPTLATEANNPSYLALHPNGRTLYAVNEGPGTVAAYAVAGETLRPLGSESSRGPYPCHLSVDPKGRRVLVANYGGGLAGFPIRADGSLAPASETFTNSGSGPDKSRQNEPHAHFVAPDPKGGAAYACDLGTDEIVVLDPATLTRRSSAKSPPGGGPRHLAFGAGARFVYANNEMGRSVTVYARDAKSGSLTSVQTISTVSGNPSGSTAEIAVHPNGRWLYVSNRGPDTIAAYRIAKDGTLATIAIEASGVKEPRGFGIDPSGRWLVVAGQNSNDLTALRIDGRTGRLRPTGQKVAVGKPVCVVFAGR